LRKRGRSGLFRPLCAVSPQYSKILSRANFASFVPLLTDGHGEALAVLFALLIGVTHLAMLGNS
jgi:hypothetical protein